MSEPRSSCCKAKLNVHTGGEGTSFYVCSECRMACDESAQPQQDQMETVEQTANRLMGGLLSMHLNRTDLMMWLVAERKANAAELSNLNKVVEDLGNEREEIINELVLARGSVSRLTAELADLRQVVRGLRGEVTHFKEERDKASAILQDTVENLKKNKRAVGEKQEEIATLQEQITKLEAERTDLINKAITSQGIICRLEAKLSVATEVLKKIANEMHKDNHTTWAKQALAQIEGTKMTHRDTECDNASEGEVATS